MFRRISWVFGWLRPLGRRPTWGILFVGLTAFAGCLLLAWRGGVRAPAVHDELSYLLAADTFLHGRVTNPSPPSYSHFETPQVLVHPTYMSKYPPGQGLALAFGRLIAGSAIVGIWASVAAACAAICWMLLAWVPARWAVAGGMLAVSRLVFLGGDGWWSQRYWGGAVAALGGALLFGAWRRLSVSGRSRDAIWLGVGLLILASSRPFEGLLVAAPVLAMLLFQAVRPGGAFLRSWLVLVPLAAVLVPGFLATGLYNHAITGDFWKLPHLAYQEQYTAAPQFLWLTPGRTPTYGNPQMESLHVARELDIFHRLQHPTNWLEDLSLRWSDLWRFFVGVPLVFSVVALPWVLRDRWMRRVMATLLILLLGLASLTWYFPHYVAPGTALIVLLLVECLRRLRTLKLGRWRFGRVIVPAIAAFCLVQIAAFVKHYRIPRDWSAHRQRLQAEMLHSGGEHLVFVHYLKWHSPHDEWVYNDADLIHAPVVWARMMGAVPDQELIAALPGRTVWQVEADAQAPRLRPLQKR